jgi:hypothetical protein
MSCSTKKGMLLQKVKNVFGPDFSPYVQKMLL